MTQVIRSINPAVDLRELVVQVETMDETHTAEYRPRPDTLYANYRLEEGLIEPAPSMIAVDDVLTTGAHFKAMKRILQETFDVSVIGIFLARRVPDTA